jgi:hypothetical protein
VTAGKFLATSGNSDRQNITISLSRQVLRKAKVLAARRETSISRLLAQEIESLVGEDEAYERAERQATAPSRSRLSHGRANPRKPGRTA